ncbi:MAG TPA: UDP-N-acetylmuramate--L-alanine ligase [Atribacteraceae bacterium]|nr:UDP-N-acetylmuramate--L-alanine ligase [Atribacteraceae bacterium]
MERETLSLPRDLFFIGIGGTGMSGLALIARGMGYRVSGSDITESEMTVRLRERGIPVYVGHCRERIQRNGAVIVSSAIPAENEELCAARELRLPIVHRGVMLASLLNRKRGIAVSGTHGKTTTTSLISLLLETAGLQPTVLIGGELEDIGGNAKIGESDLFVAEADESDGSFLKLRPYCGVITNIEDDHLEHYGSMDKAVEAYQIFLERIKPGGLAVLCKDHPNVRTIIPTRKRSFRVLTYGMTEEELDCRALVLREKQRGYAFRVSNGKHSLGDFETNIPGLFNVLNALACIAVGVELEIGSSTIRDAIASFSGVKRRFECIGFYRGTQVVDDYAHHPTEMEVVLQAAVHQTAGRLVVVFQPHRYTRTGRLYREMAQMLGSAHRVLILPIYPAGERPVENVTSELVYRAMKEKGYDQAFLSESLDDAVRILEEWLEPGDLLITMGAGDVWKVGTCLCGKT